MKRAIFFAFPSLFFLACGGDPGVMPDLTVGETDVFIMPDAPVPPDLAEGLSFGRAAVSSRLGLEVAREAFDFRLILHPESVELPGAEGETFPLGTYLDANQSPSGEAEIHIICFEEEYAPLDKTVNTYLFHELVQHHIPFMLGRGRNDDHDVFWSKHDFFIRLSVMRSLAEVE